MAQTASRATEREAEAGRQEEPARIDERELEEARDHPQRRELAEAAKRYWARVRKSGFGGG
jgi:hypothetical protein